MSRLCDDCGVANDDGTPCGLMFTKDQIERCSRYEKDEKRHAKLADKFGPDKKKETDKKPEK